MSQLNRLVTLSLLSACFWVQGCTSVKKTLGIDRDPPDEFSVMPCTQPLDMPPDFFVLPKPQPGIPRPQDVKAMESKRKELFGGQKKSGVVSPGQAVLLDMAGASNNPEDIRRTIDDEHRKEASKKNPVLETFGIKQSKDTIIDPYEEKKNLEEKKTSQKQSIPPAKSQ